MVPIIEDKDIIIIIRLFFSALASYLQGTLDEEIGEKTSISFLLDMNELFEEFVGNLLRKAQVI
jgi:hypothetical protein